MDQAPFALPAYIAPACRRNKPLSFELEAEDLIVSGHRFIAEQHRRERPDIFSRVLVGQGNNALDLLPT